MHWLTFAFGLYAALVVGSSLWVFWLALHAPNSEE